MIAHLDRRDRLRSSPPRRRVSLTSACRAEDDWGRPRAGPAAGVEAIAWTEEQQEGSRRLKLL